MVVQREAATDLGGGPGQYQVPGVDELWKVVQEQQARIDRLEAVPPPLPPAEDRVALGRRPVQTHRPLRRPRSRSQPISAADAFKDLAPITARYATVPIGEGFNWAECSTFLVPGEWYMVVFRSKRWEAADDLTLEMHDYGAYIEAQRRAVGLVYYFRGTTNERRECLSFCIWNSRQEAVRAAQLPLHRVAMTMVNEKYETYTLERYSIRKERGKDMLEFTSLGNLVGGPGGN